MTEANQLYERIAGTITPAVGGHAETVELLTVALLARGHVLLGGWPTMESALVVESFGRALGLSRRRVRLTPDLELPDLIGPADTSNDGTPPPGQAFSANLLQADEINRAPPRIQGAIIEAIDEGQVSVRGTSVEFPQPFMTVATLNPVESEEVYGLPASHRDRFLFWLRLGDIDFDAGMGLLERYDHGHPIGADAIEPVANPDDVLAVRDAIEATYADASIREYLLEVVLATRDHPDVEHGATTRASLPLLRTAKAIAAVRDRDFVIPDDVNAIAPPSLAPRLVLATEAELNDVEPEDVVLDVLDSVDPPGTAFDAGGDAPPAGRGEFD